MSRSRSNGPRNSGAAAALTAAALTVLLGSPALAASQPADPPEAPAVAVEPPALAPVPKPKAPPTPIPRLTDTQAALLRDVLAKARVQGLRPSTEGDEGVRQNVDLAAPDQRGLVEATLDYAKAVHVGRLAPGDYLKDWGLRPAAYDPAPAFAAAVKADKLEGWLAGLPPQYTGYEALQKGLVGYRALEAAGGWPTLPAGETLAVGSGGARVLTLRRRLAIETGGPQADGGSGVYDEALAEDVRKAQRRYGLRPTGAVDAATLAALNVPASERVTQIEANLERWRWLPAELPADRIQVNIAAAVLTVFKGDQPLTSMRSVTGRPGDETPMLTSEIKSIVINPPWNVPSGIAAKEYWPKERAHPGYLAQHGFRVISTPDGGSRLQQRSEQSALGKFKFDFSNPYGVYLHDTPTHGTFAKYARMVSHGCVRLEKPAELAKLVMQGDPVWTPEAIDQAVVDGKTIRVPLPKPLQVYLLYWTAFAAPDGQVNFRADPYGWDEVLGAKLRAAGRPPAPAAPPTVVAAQ